uniref:Ig-like domain-containing protein n=1 Tax=Oreochromis niloticus TaxID=8128 RepID=A0A669DI66_ORENI
MFLGFSHLRPRGLSLQQDVQVKFGDDITLQCQISTDEIISVLKWSRADLNTDGYVYFYRNKRSYENYQHPSFHGRVKLKDSEMKDGDVSLILKNVTFNDAGIYECHIIKLCCGAAIYWPLSATTASLNFSNIDSMSALCAEAVLVLMQRKSHTNRYKLPNMSLLNTFYRFVHTGGVTSRQ